MATAWFLDLDGAKSGPYQTQEVLSLVAEGEILPHHLIGSNLKEGPWISVLEWRLNQAKIVPAQEVNSDPTKPIPWPETKIELQKPEQPQAQPLPAVPNMPSPTLTSQPNYKSVLPTGASPTPKTAPEAIHSPLNPPSPYIAPVNEDLKPTKRDPMAEMFDVLQRSKQKREEKQILTAQTQHAAAELSRPPKAEHSSNSNSFLKTALMGLGITIAGFWLGQWFQKSAPPKEAAPAQTVAQSSQPAPTASPQNTADSSTPMAHHNMQEAHVMEDRSTDKIQIRGKVAPPVPPGQPTGNAEPEALNAAKDLKELQDLKKELQELKNLKDELKNSIHEDGFQPDGEMDIDPQNPDAVGGDGKPLINPDIHY